MRKSAIIIIFILLGLFLLGACNQEENGPETGGTAAAEVIPTSTPTPTPTLPATYTAVPMSHGGHLYAVSSRATHIVQPGETLGIIANMYGITVEALARANRIYNYDLIEAGETLFVPPCE